MGVIYEAADHMVGLLVRFEFRTGDEDSSPLTRADRENYI